MFKKKISNLSSRKKLLMLAFVAVMLPLAILTFVQYRSLIELESRTQGAFKENLRQTLFSVVNRIESKFEETASQTLIPLGSLRNVAQEEPPQLEKYFQEIKQNHPEIDQIFLVSHCADCENKKLSLFIYTDSFRKLNFSELMSDMKLLTILDSFQNAHTSQNYLDANRNFLFGQHSCPMCTHRGQPYHATFVFYPLTDIGNQKHMGFAGLTFKEEYVQKELLAGNVAETLDSSDLAVHGSSVAISISDENKNEILATAPGPQTYAINTAFSRPFINWEISIGFKDTTVERMAWHGFWQSLSLNFLVMAFLLLGIVLTFRATDREVSLAEAKSVFVSNVSHELKTPLSLIRLFAELLELGRVKDNKKKYEYYRIIGEESRRLTQLIENILDFSKIEAGRKEYVFVKMGIGEVVQNVVSSYRYQITNAGFELTTTIENDLPPVLIDSAAISQAILNLLDNAVKYSPNTRKISVEVKAQKEFLTIEIADRGLGIPVAEQVKIFEKFYRVSNGLVHDVKGSGLGLSLVKHIIEAHGGTVSVESTVGSGSRFTIRLPLGLPVSESRLREGSVTTNTGGYRVA
jgi:signal transduction histidine kinase